MKYLVTGHRTEYIEVEADSIEEAERIGADQMPPPQFWDYLEAEEHDENEVN